MPAPLRTLAASSTSSASSTTSGSTATGTDDVPPAAVAPKTEKNSPVIGGHVRLVEPVMVRTAFRPSAAGVPLPSWPGGVKRELGTACAPRLHVPGAPGRLGPAGSAGSSAGDMTAARRFAPTLRGAAGPGGRAALSVKSEAAVALAAKSAINDGAETDIGTMLAHSLVLRTKTVREADKYPQLL
eukprot:GHVT01065826.1.p1 GENE.GHVT01065826.1~~GHVT01065826.1.p1  ORF type:complete len:185 (+),score=45.43 GHVT01065826.1:472-1026(+)